MLITSNLWVNVRIVQVNIKTFVGRDLAISMLNLLKNRKKKNFTETIQINSIESCLDICLLKT